MNISKTFVKIWNIDINGNIECYKNMREAIPQQWQILLTSDGSFTRNLSILKKYIVLLKLIKQERKIYPQHIINNKQDTKYQNEFIFSREIWLTDKKKCLIFAQSYYINQVFSVSDVYVDKPLGLLLIESEIEIYREIISIYYGYSRILEQKFKAVGPFWGRSYRILYHNKIMILIHEFFSPSLTNQM